MPTDVPNPLYPEQKNAVLEHKNIDVEFKAASEDGTFVALASVFNNVDRVGDRVLPGAFKRTLRTWKASGKMLPVILSHNWDDIQAHVGYADPKEIKETARGLEVKAHLDVAESETARRVHKLMKRGQLTAMSFGYTVPSGGQERDEKGVNNLSEIDLHEVGPTLVGVNREAQVQAVKALEAEVQEQESAEPKDYDALLAFDEAQWPDLPEDVQEGLTRKAEAILSSAGIKNGKHEEPEGVKSRSHDPLRKRSMETVLEISSAGLSHRQPSQEKASPPTLDKNELRQRSRNLTLELINE